MEMRTVSNGSTSGFCFCKDLFLGCFQRQDLWNGLSERKNVEIGEWVSS